LSAWKILKVKKMKQNPKNPAQALHLVQPLHQVSWHPTVISETQPVVRVC
jgi:hypothetical protein